MDKVARFDRHWRSRLQEPEQQAVSTAGANDDPPQEFWRTAVQKYTSCDLTKGRDKLIAIWGIAKLVRDTLGVEYGAGLWEENLEDQLTWRVTDCHLHERPSESKEEHLARNIPSWSWASMDGCIEVPSFLTDAPHYVVKDHFGSPLAFDLVGVRRALSTKRPQLGESHMPAQSRGMSDSVVELQHRYKDLEQARKETSANEDAGKEVIDRDAEPRFHHTSIAIQGQICQGSLSCDIVTASWFLKAEGLEDVAIEAFPDLVPKKDGQQVLFVVLSAKQSVHPISRESTVVDEEEKSSQDNQGVQLDGDEEPAIKIEQIHEDTSFAGSYIEEVVVDGRGILMKDVGENRFHRTGAFDFRNMSLQDFAKLQKIDNEKDLLDMAKTNIGCKFWLE